MARNKPRRKYEPYAEDIIALFGGIRPFAAKYNEAFGKPGESRPPMNYSTPAKWVKNGGRIPRLRREKILELAQKHGIVLREADLGPTY